MEIILRVGTDPTSWHIYGDNFGAVAAELGQGAPVVQQVAFPLQGQLVLSPQCIGSVALLPPWSSGGGHPTDNPPPGGDPVLNEPSGGGGHPTDNPPPGGNPVLNEPSGGGGHPTDNPPPPGGSALGAAMVPAPLPLKAPTLYLPSAAGVSLESPGYALPAGAELNALAQGIQDAMASNALVEVATSNGLLVLNGAVLEFAVICPPTAQG